MLHVVPLFARFGVQDDDYLANKVSNFILTDKLNKIFDIFKPNPIYPLRSQSNIIPILTPILLLIPSILILALLVKIININQPSIPCQPLANISRYILFY